MKTPADDLMIRHLAKIVDSSDDAIVSKDLNGTILSWNAAAERMFGYTAAEAIGRSIRMIIPADRQHEEDYVLEKIRSGDVIRHHETIRQRKDGRLLNISLTVSPIFDDNGNVIAASKIARDISDRRAADLAARRLAAVVESSDDAIVAKDVDGIIQAWNRAAERMFGYTADEAIGRSIRMIIPPELQQEEDEVLARIRSGRMVDHYETRRRRKDGTDVLISLTVSPIVDSTGTVVGASKIARDITEQQRLRAAAEQRALMMHKLNAAGAAVASSLDRAAVVQKVTDIGRELTGAELGLFDPTFHGERAIRLDDVTRDPRFGQNPPYHGMPDGHLPVRSYLAVPVKDRAGEVLGGLFFGHAQVGMFTEEHEQLATGVAAWASVALENAGLYRQAREADRLKDEFLAVLSHELRTPLNAIVGYARLLRGGILTGEKAERGLETLERNAGALTQIVEDVLDVSRIVSGKIRLDVQTVELPLIVHNAVATVQPAADAKGVRLETIVDPLVGPVSGDPDRLQQVVWNLLSNAVKFTPKRGRVQIRVQRVNSHVEIAVSDTGIGIRPEFLPHVFERFRQGDAGTTRKIGGLGLGLSIVRHIVEMHGGTVTAASEGEGRGSTFRVRLPLMIVHSQSVREPTEHPRTAKQAPLSRLGRLDGIRVVAVDDDRDALQLLRVVLETAGADVVTFASPVEGIERVADINPHALVVDVGMPQIDGFDFIRRIRSSPERSVRDIPAAALTAFARSDDRTRALESGFEMHLAKPVDPGELVAAVATLVRQRTKHGRS